MLKAKELNMKYSQAIDKLIERNQKFLPTNEQVEKLGLKEGQTYYIEGWINETTTVRVRKE